MRPTSWDLSIGEARYAARIRAAAVVGASIAAALGAVSLSGWISGIDGLKALGLSIAMKTNTAVSLVLCGLAVAALTVAENSPRIRWAGRAIGAVVLLAGGLTLCEHLFAWNPGIDQFLADEVPGAMATAAPNRMGPPACVSFILLGAALLLWNRPATGARFVPQWPALGACLIGLLALLGFLYGATELYTIPGLTGIAVHTAVAFILLGLSIGAARPSDSVMAVFCRRDAGGALARRFILPAALLPPLVGWAFAAGVRKDWFDSDLAHAAMALVLAVGLVALLWSNAHRLSRADAALRRSEAHFRALAENVPSLVWTCNPDGLCDYVSPQWEHYTGAPITEHLGTGWLESIHPDDRSTVWVTWERAVAQGGTYDAEFRIRRHDGAWRWFKTRAAPVRDQAGRITRWFGTNTDIDEARRAQDHMRQSAERFELLSEVAAQLLAAPHPQSVVNELCRRALGQLGCDAFFNFLVDRPSGRLKLNTCGGIPDEVAREIEWLDYGVAVCGCVARDGCRIIAEHVQTTPDERTNLVRSFGIRAYCCHPLRVQGQTIGTLSFGSRNKDVFTDDDVSLMRAIADMVAIAMQRLILLEEAQAGREQAERANAAKDAFLATLSHELRTPLMPVLMAASELGSREDLPAEVRSDLHMMRENVQLEARIIDDLLDLTRIARGKLHFDMRPADLHHLIARAAQICSHGEGAPIVLELHAPEHHVTGDAARLQQVFWNLLNNARKFTPHQGKIIVRTESENGRIRASVADTGAGVDPESLPRIFNAFEQGAAGKALKFGGLGLGLAISRAIVEAHGGSITAHSDGPGTGATFALELSAIPAPEPVSETKEDPNALVAGMLRVLLVEDHDITRKVMIRQLRSMGCEVHSAPSVAAARELAEGHEFDLVISDLGLPDGTGYELMQSLRDQYGLPGIALSGYGMEDDIRRSIESGFLQHLTKPINKDQLTTAVRQFLAVGSRG